MLLNENIILKKKYFCLLKDDIEKMNNNKKIKDYLYKINHHSYVLINKEYHYYQNLITLWRKEDDKEKNDYNNRLHFEDGSIKGLHDLNIENLTTCYLITDEPTRDQSNFETLNNRNILSEEENIQIIQILLNSIEDNEIKKTVGRLMGNKNYTLIIKTSIKYINNH